MKPTESWRGIGSESSRATCSGPGKRPRPPTPWMTSLSWCPAGILPRCWRWRAITSPTWMRTPSRVPIPSRLSSCLPPCCVKVERSSSPQTPIRCTTKPRWWSLSASGPECLRGGRPRPCAGDYLRQRHQRADLAERRRAVVASQGRRHLQPDGSLHPLGRGLQPAQDGSQAERGSAPAGRHLRHDSRISETVSFISRYVTLEPGDLIFTGTPGTTKGMQPGDVVTVEIDGVGVLKNRVVAAKP